MAADGGDLNQYWAALPAEELVGELQAHERAWWRDGEQRGLWQLLRLAYAQAQGIDPQTGASNTTQQLKFCDNYLRFRVNLTRSHIKQRNILAQGQRPSFQCLALNDDFESLAQIPTAQNALDGLYRAAKGEQREWEALESDGYFGEGGVWGRWDPEGGAEVNVAKQVPVNDQFTGEPLTDETGQPVMVEEKERKKSGAPTLTSLYPWEIVREPLGRGEPAWVMVREVCSKWELAARFPEHAERIVAIDNLTKEPGIAEMFAYNTGSISTDQIIVRHFYHRACAAIPGGRYVGVADEIPLWDLPNPLPEGLPVNVVCTGRYFGTAFGYPESTDLLSMQQMIDEILTQAANNLLRYGNQSLFCEAGIEVDQRKLSQGGGFFSIPVGLNPPQAIQWAQLPAATLPVLEFLLERMNEISGMNSVARGAPEANISSGTFAALMLNIAEKFVSATEMSLDALRNANGTMLLQLTRANCEDEFIAEVAGVSQQPYMRTFKVSDFKGIQRVQVAQRSPLMAQIPGRFEVYNAIAPLPPEQRAAAYQLLTTGNADAFTESDQSETLLIQYENEQLSKGEWCEPSKTDNHMLHAQKHKAQFDKMRTNPNADPNALVMIGQHLSAHGVAWCDADPVLSMMLKQPLSPLVSGFQQPAQDAAAVGGAAPQVPPTGEAGEGQTPLPDAAQAPAGAQSQDEGAAIAA